MVASAASTELATAQLRGQDHLIVPCVMIVEGVLHSSNASDPALALASEFGITPQGWDGRPTVYNHPQEDGIAVSANRPKGWEDEVIGLCFNTSLDGKKLKTDLWLDISRTPQVVIDGLKNGDEFEVSTGLFAQAEDASGKFDGKEYKMIWRNIVPDHLAILEKGSVGACSIADGCGAMRTNSKGQEVYMNISAQTQGDSGASSAKKKEDVVAASAAPSECGCQPTQFELAVNKLPKGLRMVVNQVASLFKTNELSDNDIRTAIQAGLDAQESFAYASVYAVFDSYVIFSAMSRSDYEWAAYKVSYTVAEGGAISIGSDAIRVRPETTYVPVVVAGNSADDDSLTTNSAQEDHIVAISKEELAELATQVAAQLKPTLATQSAEQLASAATAGAAALVETPAVGLLANMDAVTAACTPEVAAQIKDSVAFATNVRKTVIANLVKTGYVEADLANVPLNVLQKMAAAPAPGTGTDFSGLGTVIVSQVAKPDASFTPPSKTFAPVKA